MEMLLQPAPKAHTGFLDLPVEIRLQTYRHCVQLTPKEASIYAWYKGGEQKPDDRNDRPKKGGISKYCAPHKKKKKQNNGFYIYASHAFQPALLLLNRTIHAEAREELYRAIHFRIEARLPRFHMPILEYWLIEHPMSFSRHISFTIDFATNPSRRLKKDFPYLSRRETLAGHNSYLGKATIQQLATILSSMPNLEQVTLLLCLDCCGGWDSRPQLLDNICLQDVLYINRLKAFQDFLRRQGEQLAAAKEVRLRLVVSCSEWWLGYSEPDAKEKIVERLRREGFEAQLAKVARCSVSRLSWSI